MNKIYLVDGKPYEVGPSKEQQFLEDFKDKNPILQDDELGKSTGASQPRNNQQNTESLSEDISLDFTLSPEVLNNVLKLKNQKQFDNRFVRTDNLSVATNNRVNIDFGLKQKKDNEEDLQYNNTVNKYKKSNKTDYDIFSDDKNTFSSIEQANKAIQNFDKNKINKYTVISPPTGKNLKPGLSTFYYGTDSSGNTFNVSDTDPTTKERFNEIKNLQDQIDKSKNVLEGGFGDMYEGLTTSQINRKFDENKNRSASYYTEDEKPSEFETLNELDYNYKQLETSFNKTLPIFKKSQETKLEELTTKIQNEYTELLNNPEINTRIKSDPQLKDILRQVESGQKNFFLYGEGKKLFDDYRNKWSEFSKTEEYKNMSNAEKQQALKKLEDDLDKEANLLAEEAFKPMLDAYNKRYEIVSKFQPEIQAIDEKYSNEYKQSYDKDLKDFMNGNFDVYKKWDIGALEEISEDLLQQGLINDEVHYEDKKQMLDEALKKYLQIYEEQELIDSVEDRQAYITEYYNYFYPKLKYQQKEENGERILSHFYNKDFANLLKKEVGKMRGDISIIKDTPQFTEMYNALDYEDKIKKGLLEYKGGGYYRVPQYKINSYNPKLEEIKKEVIEDGFKGNDIDQEVARRYYANVETTLDHIDYWADKVIDDPESMRDAPLNSGLLLGFNELFEREKTPFIGALIDFGYGKRVRDAANKPDDKLTPEDKLLLAMSEIKSNSEQAKSEISNGYRIGKGFAETLPFIGEFIATGPAFRAAFSTAKAGVNMAIASKYTKKIIPSLGKARVSKDGSRLLFVKGNKARQLGTDFIAGLMGVSSQTAANPFRIAATQMDLMTDEHMMAFSFTDDEMAQIDAHTASGPKGEDLGLKEGYSRGEALKRSFLKNASETFTERIGYYIPSVFKGGMKVLKKTPLKSFAESKNWKKIAIGQFMRKNGMATPADFLNWSAKNAGYNGFAAEFIEELVNMPLSNLADGRGKALEGIRKYDEFGNDLGFDWKGMRELASTVALVSASFGGGGIAYGKAMGYKPAYREVDGIMYDSQSEFMAALRKAKRDGKLNKDLQIKVYNDYVTLDDAISYLEKNKLSADQVKTNSPETKLNNTATETEIQAEINKTDPKKSIRLSEINERISQLKLGPKSSKSEKEISDLTKEKNEIIAPVKDVIIKRKNTEQYKQTVKKVRAIIEKEKLKEKGLIDVVEGKTNAEAEAKLLAKLGLKRVSLVETNNTGKIVDINTGKVVTEIENKETKKKINIETFLNEAKTAHGYFLTNEMLPEGQPSFIVFNQQLSVETNGTNVASHEFFHFFLQETLNKSPELKIALGAAFEAHLRSIDPRMVRDGEYRKRLNNYLNADLETKTEEGMALFLDGLATGSMNYNDGMMAGISAIFRNIGHNLGLQIELNSGQDVYNFIKDFNSTIQRGDFSKSFKEAFKKKIKVGGAVKELAESSEMKKAVEQDKAKQSLLNFLDKIGVKFSKVIPEDDPMFSVFPDVTSEQIVQKNAEIYNKIKDIANKENITMKEVLDRDDRRTRRLKEELVVYNHKAAYKYANEAHSFIKNKLANTNFLAPPLADIRQEMLAELVLLTNRWNPTKFPDVQFGAFVQMPLGLPIKKGQVVRAASKQAGNTVSLDEMRENGFDTFSDVTSTSSSTNITKVGSLFVADFVGIDRNNVQDIVSKSDLSKIIKKPSYKQVKQEVKTGSLKPVLKLFADAFGVPAKKISTSSNLDAEQRKAARDLIVKLAENNNLMETFLPDGTDASGKATGIAITKLGSLYIKGAPVRSAVTGSTQGLEEKIKPKNVTNKQVLELFGIDEKGNILDKKIKQEKYDGAIREFIANMAALGANQEIRVTNPELRSIGDPKPSVMFSQPAVNSNLKKGDLINSLATQQVDGVATVLDQFDQGLVKIDYLLTNVHGKEVKGGIYRIKTKEDVKPFIDNLTASGFFKSLPLDFFFQRKSGKNSRHAYYKKTLKETGQGAETNASIFSGGHKLFGFKTSKDPAWAEVQIQMQELYNEHKDDASFWGKDFKGVNMKEMYSLRNKYNSLFFTGENFDLKKARANKKEVLKFNDQVGKIHRQMWERFAEMIKDNKSNARAIGTYLSLVGNDRSHWHKLGAQVAGYSTKLQPFLHKGKMKTKVELEHAMPATQAYLYLLHSALGLPKKEGEGVDINFNEAYNSIIKNYKLIVLDKAMDHKLTSAKTLRTKKSLQKVMPDDWSVIDGYFWQRYFNDLVAANNGGIDPSTLEDLDGVTFDVKYNINASGSIKILKPTYTTQVNQNIQKSFSNSGKFSKSGETRGMSTFDFDDTLAKTKSGVRATLPNTDGLPKPNRKVIFLAGGAGSGKGNVVSKLGLSGMGFKIVNSDISLEWLKKNSGLPADMRDLTPEQRSTLGKLGHQARQIARNKMMKYQGNANGVVVDGTGGSVKSMQKLVDEFKSKGYDVSMVFVETSLDVALKRNRARQERSLLDTIVKRNHEAVQNNKPAFKEMFGDRFMEVNTDNLKQEDPMPADIVQQMDDFVSSYEKLRLDAEEFASQGDDILKQGGSFDFSEFNEVVDGTPGPLLDKAKQRAEKFGTDNMFVLTARPAASALAIQQFLKSQDLDIPIENITGLANSTGEAKAEWMLSKFAEGYNDMYFVDDAFQNVEAVKKVLDQLDIKSEVVQARAKFSRSASSELNNMIERKKGVDAFKIFSEAEAKKRGKGIGRFRIYIPPSAEDFKGLLYYFMGRGEQGNKDMKFFEDNLLRPFAKGIRAWNTYKQNMVNDYKNLKKQFPKLKLNKKIPNSVYTNDTSVRVYLWDKAGFDIPGISSSEKQMLIDNVNNNPDLKSFADSLSKITKRAEGYIEPTENWSIGSIGTDLRTTVNKVGRKEFLENWIENKNLIFSPENLNKIEAVYGTRFREALDDILYRMENGGNRKQGSNRVVNDFNDWINGSVGAIMFFNMRSAILQTLSTINFVNWSDNNIFKASAAFANQPQFWKDFTMLFNSDMLKQRRAGLQMDMNASELAKSFAENGYSPTTVISYLLQLGFKPTQIADSFAIAFGGASFVRNRINTYKKRGLSDTEAKNKAMLDFQEIAEETQQSSREDLISMQQASVLGRLVLAFQNVTMQYGRLTKKALSDLVNRRGDTKTNISKIIYYGFVQNVVFAALQNGLSFLLFGSDDEELIDDKASRAFNSALDSFLRGMGIHGALASTLKNTAIEWQKQKSAGFGKERPEKIMQAVVNLSPPAGSKVRKIMQAYYSDAYNEGVPEQLGWRLENPNFAMAASLTEALTNIPAARLLNKANNLEEAITGSHEPWKRAALVAGWDKWSLGIKDEELEQAKEDAKKQRARDKKINKDKKQKVSGQKEVRCHGINSQGNRCGLTAVTDVKRWKCFHHRNQ